MPRCLSRFSLTLLLRATAPDARTDVPANPFDIDRIADYVGDLERHGYDRVVLADSLDTSTVGTGNAPLGLEAFTQAAYLAVKTSRIGVTVSANTNYVEPFGLARLLASLDHISHGRAAWLVSIDESGNSAYNHQQAETALDVRRPRRDEAVAVIEGLFTSWEDGAFLRNKDMGAFVDPAKIHPLDHHGRFFQVRGPLNVARPPQGRLPKLTSVGADGDDDIAALSRYDGIIVSGRGDAEARTLKTRLADAGSADAPRLLKRLTPVLRGVSLAAADDAALAHLRRATPEEDLFIGTIDDWRRQCARWPADASPWDGLLIDPAPADYLNGALAEALAAADHGSAAPLRSVAS